MRSNIFHFCTFAIFLALMSQHPLNAAEYSYRYILSWEAPQTHEYHISLTTEPQEGDYTLFQLPAWRPGRYYLQDFAAGVSFFEAVDEKGKKLDWIKTATHDWRVQNPARGLITIRYRFYANVLDAGSSVLNHEQAYFNGINLFMSVAGRYDSPCVVTVPSMPAGWKAATALRKKAEQHNVFYADSFHDLVDSPTILSPTLTTLHTKVDGVDYHLYFQGKFIGGEDVKEAVLSNVRRIAQEQSAIFGNLPLEEYHFLFQLVPYRASHAVEHKNSSMYMRHDEAFSSVETVRSVNGVISHEFFHLWNVKRIRPAAMWPYNYQKEAYTGLHWFTEGVTNYYADLTLVRAGLLAQPSYFGNIGRSITRLENSYATSVVSPHYSSYDSWLSRSRYANPLHRNSYYALGDRMGLLLDLELRSRTNGKKSLDDVFRFLYQNYYQQGKGVPENGIQLTCEAITRTSFNDFFQQYVMGTTPINYETWLNPMGLQIERSVNDKGGLAHVGIARAEELSDFLEVQAVVPGSDASLSGLSDGMVILAINGQKPQKFDANEFFENGIAGKKLTMKVYINEEQQELVIPVSGRQTQYIYRVRKMEKVSARQERMLQNWLKSQVSTNGSNGQDD